MAVDGKIERRRRNRSHKKESRRAVSCKPYCDGWFSGLQAEHDDRKTWVMNILMEEKTCTEFCKKGSSWLLTAEYSSPCNALTRARAKSRGVNTRLCSHIVDLSPPCSCKTFFPSLPQGFFLLQYLVGDPEHPHGLQQEPQSLYSAAWPGCWHWSC